MVVGYKCGAVTQQWGEVRSHNGEHLHIAIAAWKGKWPLTAPAVFTVLPSPLTPPTPLAAVLLCKGDLHTQQGLCQLLGSAAFIVTLYAFSMLL